MAGGRDDSIEIDLEPLRATGERALRVLERFAGYEILGRLATAGAHELLVARERTGRAARLVTLKVMRPRAARDPELVRTFTADARVALRLEHPALCKAYRSGTEEGVPYVAMELVHGISVRDLIGRAGARGDVLVPEIAVAIVAIVADACHAVHLARARAGDLVAGPRQDLGTDDVMLALDGTVKLFATPRGPEADVFSLGVLLHEMLTGRRPSARALDEHVWPRAVPPDLAPVLERALADDEEERYPSALALHDDLERWLAQRGEVVAQARIAEAVLAVSEQAHGDHGRDAFVALRAGDATRAHRLPPPRSGIAGRVLSFVLIAAVVALALVLASIGIAL